MENQSQTQVPETNCFSNFLNEENSSISWPSSTLDERGCPTGPSLSAATIAIGVLLILIILASIAGNLLVCLAIYTDRKLRKLGNLFLVSLAVADLFVACIVMTISLVNDLMGYWIFGEQFCDIWISCDVMCCTASILNLCAISLDRFIHIKDPFRYAQWMTKKTIILAVVFIWFISGLISFVPISLGWHKPEASHNTSSVGNERFICTLDLTPTYAVLSSLISFYLPCLIMIALYARLYVYARKHVKNIQTLTKPLHSNSISSSDQRASNHHIMDHKAAITLGVIMGVFLFCWVPFFCLNVVAGFCKTCVPEKVFKIITYLGWFNSSMNPAIYSIFNTEFRDAFRRIIFSYAKTRCCCCSHKQRMDSPRRGSSKSENDQLAGQSRKLISKDPRLVAVHSSLKANSGKGKPSTGTSGYLEVVPVKHKFEIVCHMDGKISAL